MPGPSGIPPAKRPRVSTPCHCPHQAEPEASEEEGEEGEVHSLDGTEEASQEDGDKFPQGHCLMLPDQFSQVYSDILQLLEAPEGSRASTLIPGEATKAYLLLLSLFLCSSLPFFSSLRPEPTSIPAWPDSVSLSHHPTWPKTGCSQHHCQQSVLHLICG